MSNIRMALFDVDGVLTDGGIFLDKDGEEIMRFHVRDGAGLRNLIKNNIQVGIITGRGCPALMHRLRHLEIELIYTHAKNKLIVYEQILKQYQLKDEEISYMGDDRLDIPVLERVGLPSCPADAIDEVKQVAKLCTKKGGGQGAVRELAEYILQNNDG